MLRHTFTTQPGILQLCLNFYFLLLPSLKVSCESLGLLRSFLIKHKGLCMHVASMIPKYMLEFSKPPVDFDSSAFKALLVSLLFVPAVKTITHCLRQPWCSTVVFDCFWQTPTGKRLFYLAALSGQIKTALWVLSYREPPGSSNNNSLR